MAARVHSMKILLINKFLHPSGGDTVCTLATGRLLLQKGHQVEYWGMAHPDNPPYSFEKHFASHVDLKAKMSLPDKCKTLANMIYSIQARKALGRVLDMYRPDVIHINNIHHHISPSILDEIRQRNIPSIMTLHDYKMVCPSYYLRRPNGRQCDLCKGHRYYHCALNRCMRDSATKSVVTTVEMYIHHVLLRAFRKVNLFVSPSRFVKEKVAEMGFRGPIIHLPHFIDIPAGCPEVRPGRPRLIYFGRLAPEKGLFTLLEAVKGIDLELRVIGDGPIRDALRGKVDDESIDNVTFVGFKSGDMLQEEICSATITVIPSEWYEVFGRTIIESFALGRPVLGARIGGIEELIRDGRTGWLFKPGDVGDLREKIFEAIRDPHRAVRMGANARRYVQEHHDASDYYRQLLRVYRQAIELSR